MPAHTLQLTFGDLIIRVAEFLGSVEYAEDGEGIAIVPTDAHDLDVCKRIVNDGWRRFINSKPRWNWQRPQFTIDFDPDGEGAYNIDKDATRYYMPDGFYGQMIGWFVYSGSNIYSTIDQEDPLRVYTLIENSPTTGIPSMAGVQPLDDPHNRWELVVYPAPGSDYTIKGWCRIYPNALVELTDVPNCGFVFHEAVLASCLYEAELQKDDNMGVKQALYGEAIARAVGLDNQMVPKRMAKTGHGFGRRAWYDGVDTYTNLDGTVHTF